MSEKWTAQKVIELMDLMRRLDVASLDMPIKTDDPYPSVIGDFVLDDGPTPDDIVAENELCRILLEAVEKLPPRQQSVIKLRFGLETRKPMTLEEVGEKYGVTRERIRQIEAKGLKTLRWLLLTKYKIKEQI